MEETRPEPMVTGIDEKVRHQQVALLYENARLPIVANAVNASLLAYVNSTLGASARIAFSWAAVLAVIAVGRLLLVRAYHRTDADSRNFDRWLKYFSLGTLLAAGAWGAGAFLFMWRAPEASYLFSGLVISGTVAGGIASLGPVINVYRAFALLMLVPMSSAVLLNAVTPLDWAFGGLTLFFMVIVLRGATSLHETIGNSLRLRLVQQALLSTVEQTRDQAQAMVIELRRKEAALADSEERYRLIVHHSPTGIVHYSNDLIITYCNERFAEIVQAPQEKLIGLDMKTLRDQRVLESMTKALDGSTQAYEGEYVATLSGKRLWVSMSCSALIGPDHQVDGGIAIVQDITERRRDEEALRESEARLLLMLETSPIAVRIADSEGCRVLFANQRYAELIQTTPEGMLDANPADYYANPADYREVLAILAQGGQVEHRLVELRMPDGLSKWVLASYLMLTYKGQPAVLGWFYDVTKQKEAERQLEHLATTDPLTGLHNRRSFMDIAERELSRAKRHNSPLAIMMLDLDHFKTINDTHGHLVGDSVIHAFGMLCQQSTRAFDTVGRIGGEEFVVLLPESSLEQALAVAERLRQATERMRLSLEHGLPLQFTVSIGVAVTSGSTPNVDTLLSQADGALYEAKRAGRNRVCPHHEDA